MRKRRFLVCTVLPAGAILVCLTLFHRPLPARPADKPLVITGIAGSTDTIGGEAVLREAYGRLGLDFVVRRLKGSEALEQSNSGAVDGELQRIDGITRTFANLVQVPIPVNYLQGAAFSKKYSFPVKGWISLRSYRIGIVRGIIFAREGTRGMDVAVADTYEELVDWLERGEVEVAVMPRINGLAVIREHRSKHIRELEGVLETLFLYHYLHQKNAHLVEPLEKELKRMLLDGTTKRIREETYGKILETGEGS